MANNIRSLLLATGSSKFYEEVRKGLEMAITLMRNGQKMTVQQAIFIGLTYYAPMPMFSALEGLFKHELGEEKMQSKNPSVLEKILEGIPPRDE